LEGEGFGPEGDDPDEIEVVADCTINKGKSLGAVDRHDSHFQSSQHSEAL
jgi:hypothetical protein